jgi:hypothetical protein
MDPGWWYSIGTMRTPLEGWKHLNRRDLSLKLQPHVWHARIPSLQFFPYY